jgi:hypothetical protein
MLRFLGSQRCEEAERLRREERAVAATRILVWPVHIMHILFDCMRRTQLPPTLKVPLPELGRLGSN